MTYMLKVRIKLKTINEEINIMIKSLRWRSRRKTGRYQNGELFLKHSRLIQTPIIKMANFFRVIKMANIFLSKWRTFSDLSKWRTFFMKMANFFLSKWRISFYDNSQNGEFFAVVMKCLKGLTQKSRLFAQIQNSKVGSILLMVVVSMLPHAEIGGNDHREEAPYFRNF